MAWARSYSAGGILVPIVLTIVAASSVSARFWDWLMNWLAALLSPRD